MKDICIFFPFGSVVSGTLISMVDLYLNLKSFNYNIPIVIQSKNNTELFRFSRRYLNNNMFLFNNITTSNIISCDIVITSLQSFSHIMFENTDLIFDTDKLIIFDTADFISMEHKYKCIDNFYKTINNSTKKCKDVLFYANKFNIDRYIKPYFDHKEYYHKLCKERLNWNIPLNINGKYLSTVSQEHSDIYKDVKKNDVSIYEYNGYNYQRWCPFGDIYYENIGKLIYEYLYYDKPVIYSPTNKMFDDGLTYYLKQFDIDDNKFQVLDITSNDIELKMFMNKYDNILSDISA